MTDLLEKTSASGSEPRERLPAESMEEFLRGERRVYPALRRGDIVTGVIVIIERDEIMIDVGLKMEGIVPSREVHQLESDFMASLKVGDEVPVYVIQPENQDGQAVLSLERAFSEQSWRILEEHLERGDILEAQVMDYNKGGLIVNALGLRGFVPASQVVSRRLNGDAADWEGQMAQVVGQKLHLKVLEINRRRNRLILSERAAWQEWRVQQREKILSELQDGQIRRGRVTSLRSFGAFVDLGGIDGLAHLSELSWTRVNDPSEVLQVGDEVEVYVMGVDADAKRVALSLRRAHPEPWQQVAERYQEGQIVSGTVTKLADFGAFAQVDGIIEGLIHISELADRRITHPKEVVKEGDVLTLKIVKIEPERQRLALSLRQAREDASLADTS